ncbi:protein usf [Aplysia californica]|uniref:Protein usf n=1 Tax=Aplysia californica TaxID=6500 RepID=A0ABM0JSK5_APLCA|nr:protein usf [Aplysia californica]
MAGVKVEVPSPNPQGPCPAVVFGDLNTSPAAVIVIQEWWGMNQHIQDVGLEVSKGLKSAATLVPDLYRGKVTKDREQAAHYAADLDWAGAIQDIDACARYLKSQGVKKVGVTGFCLGGAVTIATVANYGSIDAAAPFYGIPKKDVFAFDPAKIKVPIQCHFGELDDKVGFSSPADYEKLKADLEASGAELEFYTYNAQHAFTNKTSPTFDKQAYETSFSRMFQFFEKYLS